MKYASSFYFSNEDICELIRKEISLACGKEISLEQVQKLAQFEYSDFPEETEETNKLSIEDLRSISIYLDAYQPEEINES